MKRTLHQTLAVTAVISGLFGSGCGGKPPPCSPTGPSCIAWPPQGWPEKAQKLQLAEEWAVFFSKSAFSKLPAPSKARFKVDMESLLKRVNDADQRLIDAASQSKTVAPSEEMEAVTSAVTELVLLVQKAEKAAIAGESPPSAADQVSIADDLTNARKRLSDMQFLAKN